MNNVSVFFNNRTFTKDSFSISDTPVVFGDWCLTPVRCLFDGNKVTVSNKDGSLTVDHEKEYATSGYRRNFLQVVASIVLIIPGLIIGSVFKGLGYLSQSTRKRHNLATQHYTPLDRTIGSPEARLNLEGLRQKLNQIRQVNNLNQPTKNLVIYAEEGTTINEDPGLISLQPQKIILVDARIVHQPSALGRLDEALSRDSCWESR